jgi:hypothetical protein
MSFEQNPTVVRHRLVPALLLLLLCATVGWAADQVVVEDWSQAPVGAKGIPPGWKGQNWGSPKYDFTVVQDDGRKGLHLKSANDGSTVSKDVKGTVDLKATPVLEWSWKAVVLPKGGDSRKKATDDQAAQVFVVWPRFPEAVRSRIIGYVWDTTAPVGTIARSEKTGTVTYVVLRTGTAELGKWVTERRNVADDFRKIYGEEPESPSGVSISIDSNDTGSTAESFVGGIFFKKP